MQCGEGQVGYWLWLGSSVFLLRKLWTAPETFFLRATERIQNRKQLSQLDRPDGTSVEKFELLYDRHYENSFLQKEK
jgi:hypothetical protein